MAFAMHNLMLAACFRFLPCLSWRASPLRSGLFSKGGLRTRRAPMPMQAVVADDRLQPVTVAERAFLDLVTLKTQGMDSAAIAREATRVYQQFGIVRIPNFLTTDEADAIVHEAQELQSKRRTAYAQESQADRYTLWLADGKGSIIPRDNSSMLHQVLDGDVATVWRSCTSQLGVSVVGLAETVTSLPGGAAQSWHQDGTGVTIQIALCPIGLQQGPTEIWPWPFRAEQAIAMTQRGKEYHKFANIAKALHRLERPLYEGTKIVSIAAWCVLSSLISHTQATNAIRLGLLPPPPAVRLTADVGSLILYDAAMQHRGGANRGKYARPILAVHVRKDDKFVADRTYKQFT